MDVAEDPMWYLIKLGSNDFSVQYTGPNPDTAFPVDITGSSSIALLMKDDELMTMVENFHGKLQHSATANEDNKPPPSVSNDRPEPMIDIVRRYEHEIMATNNHRTDSTMLRGSAEKWAVLIGIDFYKEPDHLGHPDRRPTNLSGCVADVTEVEKLLKTQYSVPSKHIFKLIAPVPMAAVSKAPVLRNSASPSKTSVSKPPWLPASPGPSVRRRVPEKSPSRYAKNEIIH
jgi:hypothetical protein